MRVEPILIFENNLDESAIPSLAETLQPTAELMFRLVNRIGSGLSGSQAFDAYQKGDPLPAWEWVAEVGNPWTVNPELRGPYYFVFVVKDNFCHLDPSCSWAEIIDEPEIGEFVKKVSRSIASIFKSKKIIYCPDNGYPESDIWSDLDDFKKISELEANILERFGPPAKTLSEIARSLSDEEMNKLFSDWEGDEFLRIKEYKGYYIDTI